jgi:protein TonB
MSSVVHSAVVALPLRYANAHPPSRPPDTGIELSACVDSDYMRTSSSLLVVIVAIHAAVLIALLYPSAPQPVMTLPQALSIRLIAPEINQPVPSKPKPQLKPKPVVTPAPPVLSIARANDASRPLNPIEVPPLVARPKPLDRAAQPAPTPDAQPAPVLQPRFNADYLNNPKPPYPALSRRLHEEGEVRLRVFVSASGNAPRVELQRSSGYDRLDRVALEIVQRWRFVPAREGDQAVAAWVVVPISFTLRSN